VERGKPVNEEEHTYLRKSKFVEGRKPKIYLSYKVVKSTGNADLMAEYVSNKSFDDEYFRKLIVEYIRKQGKANRKTIDRFIIPKLSAVLSEKQKKSKVGNFLSSLRIKGIIKNLPGYFWEAV